MVAVYVRPSRAIRHIDDGDVVLSNGRTTLLADVSGVTWTRARLRRLTAAVQAQMDHRRSIASLEDGDPDKTATDSELLAKYGGRMFIDGSDIVSRSTLISFTLVNGDLVPNVSVVR